MPDVFISYSRDDDLPRDPTDEENSRWVMNFRATLKSRLGRQADVWWDESHLDRSGSVSGMIKEAVESTSILVVIYSKFYVKSKWCAEELRLFMEAAKQSPHGSDKRLHVVWLEPVAYDERPTHFQDCLGYDFFGIDNAEQQFLLADPRPRMEEVDYFRKHQRLALEIQSQLGRMVAQPATVTVVGSEDSPQVYLAEVAPGTDAEEQRLEVAESLADSGVRVCSVPLSHIDEQDYINEVDGLLAGTGIFVQILGENPPTVLRNSNTNQGFEEIQYQRAVEAESSRSSFKMIRWRSPDFDLEKVFNPEYKSFVDAPEILKTVNIETLKSRMIPELITKYETEKRAHEKLVVIAPGGDGLPISSFVLVNSSRSAAVVSDCVGDLLDSSHVVFEEFEQPEKLANLIGSESFRDFVKGAVLTFAGKERDWILSELRDLRLVALKRGMNSPAFAVFTAEAPGESSSPLPRRASWLSMIRVNQSSDDNGEEKCVIHPDSDKEWKRFLTKVTTATGSASGGDS